MSNKKSNINLIFDMDGVLISLVSFARNYQLIARPHLKHLFEYAFANFNTVSIWTAASQEWYDEVYSKVLVWHMPADCDFHFVFTRDRCTSYYSQEHANHLVIKDLKKVWRKFKETHTKDNTLIIDDSPHTYIRNRGNAIPIQSFRHSSQVGSDDAYWGEVCEDEIHMPDNDDFLRLIELLEVIRHEESVLTFCKDIYCK